MYIVCPKCNAKFVVTPEELGENGRKVKCSKCHHVWHQNPINHLKTELKKEQVVVKDNFFTTTAIRSDEKINLPALLPIKIPAYLYSLPFLLMGMIVFLSITLFQDSLGIYSVFHNKNLTIRDLKINNNQELGKIIIDYKIFNSSTEDTKVPLVRIRLFDKNNRVIKSRVDNHTKVTLSPLQNININTEIPFPPSAKNIDVMIGNKLDFILY